jgi:hypothetical protein
VALAKRRPTINCAITIATICFDTQTIASTAVGTILGTLAGGVISFLVSRHYAKLGSDELGQQVTILGRAIEGAEIVYDAAGKKAVDIRLQLKAMLGGGGGIGAASATVTFPLQLRGTATGQTSASATVTEQANEEDAP